LELPDGHTVNIREWDGSDSKIPDPAWTTRSRWEGDLFPNAESQAQDEDSEICVDEDGKTHRFTDIISCPRSADATHERAKGIEELRPGAEYDRPTTRLFVNLSAGVPGFPFIKHTPYPGNFFIVKEEKLLDPESKLRQSAKPWGRHAGESSTGNRVCERVRRREGLTRTSRLMIKRSFDLEFFLIRR
jgi:hypothetical protein